MYVILNMTVFIICRVDGDQNLLRTLFHNKAHQQLLPETHIIFRQPPPPWFLLQTLPVPCFHHQWWQPTSHHPKRRQLQPHSASEFHRQTLKQLTNFPIYIINPLTVPQLYICPHPAQVPPYLWYWIHLKEHPLGLPLYHNHCQCKQGHLRMPLGLMGSLAQCLIHGERGIIWVISRSIGVVEADLWVSCRSLKHGIPRGEI